MLPEREVARAILLDPQDRLLLIAYEASRDVDPARPGLRRFWYTPGGGREAGETLEDTCRRELEEELGLRHAAIGPLVARRAAAQTLFRVHRFVRETYFLVRAPDARLDLSRLQETENDPVLDVRWWTLDALRASGEVIEPATIPDLFAGCVLGSAPAAPFDLAP